MIANAVVVVVERSLEVVAVFVVVAEGSLERVVVVEGSLEVVVVPIQTVVAVVVAVMMELI